LTAPLATSAFSHESRRGVKRTILGVVWIALHAERHASQDTHRSHIRDIATVDCGAQALLKILDLRTRVMTRLKGRFELRERETV
jgi:hypothetical protein